MTTETRYSRADFQSGQEVKWCPGCGDYTILASVQNFLAELDVDREKHVFVSGIGWLGMLAVWGWLVWRWQRSARV